jgi:hypothetical protein
MGVCSLELDSLRIARVQDTGNGEAGPAMYVERPGKQGRTTLLKHHVVVDEEDTIVSSGPETGVAGAPRAQVLGQPNDAHIRESALHERKPPIARGTVDKQELVFGGSVPLDRSQGRIQNALAVEVDETEGQRRRRRIGCRQIAQGDTPSSGACSSVTRLLESSTVLLTPS